VRERRRITDTGGMCNLHLTFLSNTLGVSGSISALLTIFLLLAGNCYASPLKKGDVLPLTFLTTSFSESFDAKSLKGRFLYIDFWASWCPPCRISLPFMNTLHEEFNAKNLTIIAVSVDDDESSMMNAIKNVRPKYTVVRDAEKTFIGRIDPPKMPTSYLINPEGEVIFVHEGFAAGDESVVGNKIREALQGQEK